jgi:kynurenine 3-monooxygenase
MRKAIIVGAGLVGPVLGMYLTKMDWEVTIFERNHDLRYTAGKAGRSINLTLCHRGFAALAGIGVETFVRGHAVPAYGRLIHHTDGTYRRQNYGSKCEAIYSIARNELNCLLLEKSEREYGIRFEFNQKCIDVNPDAPSVTFEDTGSKRITCKEAEAVFAVDGAHSTVRRRLRERGLLQEEEEYWEQGYKEINVPCSGHEEMSWLAEKSVLHLWPRSSYMLIGFPNAGGDFTCALHLPFQGRPSFQCLATEADVEELFRNSFPDVLPLVPAFPADFFSRPVNRMVTVRCSPWRHDGKVLLVGDAAHAIYPSYGQGANAGFEDCRVLATILNSEYHDLKKAFLAYEKERRPNTDTIANLCVEHFLEIRDRVADPVFQRRKEIEQRLSELFPEFYSPLYSTISFTDVPYVEALARSRRGSVIVDRIMKGEVGSSSLDDVIRQVVDHAGIQSRPDELIESRNRSA